MTTNYAGGKHYCEQCSREIYNKPLIFLNFHTKREMGNFFWGLSSREVYWGYPLAMELLYKDLE